MDAKVRVADVLRAVPSLVADGPMMLGGFLRLATMRASAVRSIGLVFQEAAAKHPDRAFLRFGDDEISYGEADATVNRMASALAARGVGPGSTVGIMAPNAPNTLLVALATVKLGAAAGMLNHNQRGEVLDHSVRILEATALVADAEHRALLPDALDIDTLAEQGTTDENPAETARVPAKSTAFLIFTSGTTGLPKASAMSHFRWLKSMAGLGKLGVRLRGDDTLYCCLPLYHNNALTVSLSSVLAAGATFALGKSFSASRFWDDVIRTRSTAFCYIGELCRYLLNQPERPVERQHAIRIVTGNGLRPELWDDFTSRFGIKRVAEFYGASECNLAFVNALNIPRTAGTCPLPYAVVEYDGDSARRVDGKLRKVKTGEVGLLITKVTDRAPFDGYTDSAATEKKLIRDGFKPGDCWFDTGDLVRSQGFKHVAFVDRLGDTFRWKGENVATTEVEASVDDHPDVDQSVAYGVAVPGADGKAGMAAVKLREGAAFDGASLAKHLTGRLPTYAVPLFLRLIDEVEQTSTFKSRKVDLRTEGYEVDSVHVLRDGEYVPFYADYPKDVATGTIRT